MYQELAQLYRLQILLLDCYPLGDRSFLQLIKNSHGHVKQLFIRRCGIASFGLRCLLTYNMENLTHLRLGEDKIGNMGTKLLTKCFLPNLTHFWIYYCPIGDEGVKNLTKADWPKLSFINICDCGLRLNGYLVLQQCLWRSMRQLWVDQLCAIGCCNYITVQSCSTVINNYFSFQITNKIIRDCIIDILKSRNFLAS